MIRILGIVLLAVAVAMAVLWSLRWNDSDEEWLHRHGECTHSKRICPPGDGP